MAIIPHEGLAAASCTSSLGHREQSKKQMALQASVLTFPQPLQKQAFDGL